MPETVENQRLRAGRDLVTLRERNDPVTRPVGLDEAIARAIKHNLDHRLALLQQAVQNRQLDLSRWDLLPAVAASAGLTTRNNENASSSRSILTGSQSLEPSTSQDRQRGNADLQLSWSVLDFGMSYLEARQNANRVLVTAEQRRRAIHAITQQVRAAYWLTVAAARVSVKVDPVLAQAREALARSRSVEREGLREPLEALRYQRALVEIVRALEGTQSELAVAKSQLAALMGLPPGTIYDVAIPGEEQTPPPISRPIAELEELALVNRPELREEGYQARIARTEVHKAYLRLFPNVTVSGGTYLDSNSFLANQHWADAGIRLSWGLLSLISGHDAIGLAETQRDLADVRRLALTMAVMTQVQVSVRQLKRSQQQLEQARMLDEIDTRILGQVTAQQQTAAAGDLELIRSAAAQISTELAKHRAYGDLQSALANLHASIGLDPIPQTVAAHDLATLTAAVAEANRQIADGAFMVQPPIGVEAPAYLGGGVAP